MSTNLNHNEFDHEPDEGVTVYPDERFPAPSDSTDATHDPSVYHAPSVEHDGGPIESDTNEYGVTRSTADEHNDENPVVGEGLSEHRPGESLGEWLRNDLEQTKADLHIGGANKDSS